MKGKRSGFRNTAIAKATGKQTSGAFGLVEHIIPAGAASPWIAAGFEQFVIEMSEPGKGTCPASCLASDIEKLIRVAAKYNIEISGPLPEM